jgi:hypothetical protein
MPKRSSKALVQIQKSPIPPLHQSTEMMTACALFYIEAIIKGRKKPGGLESARGNQVHKVGAEYAAWCAHKGVAMDLDAFDNFAKGAGSTAAKILGGMRESYSVDFANLLATEVPMSLDEFFQPTDVVGSIEGISGDSGLPPHFQGILDTLYLLREALKAQSDDMKTHPRPYEPSDADKALQGKMYSLFILQHFPWVEEVRFRLVFVRFKNLYREVIYTRADIPSLIETVKAARERQKMIHFNYDNGIQMEATPGDHCCYCPLLSDRSCPIGQMNDNMQLSDEDRLRFKIWDSVFSKANTKVLSAKVQATGKNVVVRDFNGKAYSFGPEETESEIYPLFQATADGIATDKDGNPVMPIVSLLMDYHHATPDDTSWYGKLSISSTELKSKLKVKSRAFLHQAIQDTAEKVTKVKLKVSKPLDSVPDEEPDEESEDNEWGEDSEF